ncbi:MAG: DNA topoisomerase VI subunit B [Halobacteriaceae archaeon]
MTSFQSTLGEGVAEELAADQRQISIAEFFEKNKHMLGFDSEARALVTAVKESVDNGLDAAEEAGILPDIYIKVSKTSGDYYRVVVEDNGPGITKEQIPKVFGKLLYGSRFHKREQNRGQQGIGISAAVLYSQLTSGKPAKITSRTQGSSEAQYFEIRIDTETNEPEIKGEEITSWDRPHGTRIELEMEANLRARPTLRDYITHTAIVNPHARIEFHEPDGELKFERATEQLPEETEEIRPHPHGVELGTLLKMLNETDSYSISGFLQEEFTRVGGKTSSAILDNFRDRYFGRAMTWQPPNETGETNLEGVIRDAVSNKTQEATTAFSDRVAKEIRSKSRVSYHGLKEIITTVANDIERDFDTTFGDTVQENARNAAWNLIITDISSDLYSLVDEGTTSRKSDATIQGWAERIASKFDNIEDSRQHILRSNLSEIVNRSADDTEKYDDATIGETARENVTDLIWSKMDRVPNDLPRVKTIADDRDIASDLLEAMKKTDIIAPPTDCLSPITEDLIEAGLRKEFDADFYTAATRDAEVHSGDPFIVEAGIAYGGEIEEDGQLNLMRFANRVPLVYQRGACVTTDVVKDIGWRNYGLDQPGGSGLPNGPVVLLVHVASTNVPFTSESKDAIANIPAIEDEIELAIREAARDLKSYLNKRESLQQRRRKQTVIASILPKMATKVSEMVDRDELDIDDSLAKIMNNVHIERAQDGDAVTLTVTNYDSTKANLEITDIVSAKPTNLSNGSVVEMDGEYFINWEPTIGSNEQATLDYTVSGNASFDLTVEGIESERLTIDQ